MLAIYLDSILYSSVLRRLRRRTTALCAALLLGAASLTGCQKESEEIDLFALLLLLFFSSQSNNSCPALSNGFSFFPTSVNRFEHTHFPYANSPVESAWFETPFGAQHFRYRSFAGAALVGGDMLFPFSARIAKTDAAADAEDPALPEDILQTLRGAGYSGRSLGIRAATYRWPDKVVPYEFATSDAISDQTDVRNAMTHWENCTDFTFVERTSQTDYVSYQADGGGCYSFVGRISGKQAVNVDAGCGFGAAVHEIGHAVGLFHEQSRSDRDNFVTIDESNIQSGRANNYDKESSAVDLGAYDFDSIMHYGSYFFAADSSKPVMTKKDGSIIDPNRENLSKGDIDGIAELYRDYAN